MKPSRCKSNRAPSFVRLIEQSTLPEIITELCVLTNGRTPTEIDGFDDYPELHTEMVPESFVEGLAMFIIDALDEYPPFRSQERFIKHSLRCIPRGEMVEYVGVFRYNSNGAGKTPQVVSGTYRYIKKISH